MNIYMYIYIHMYMYIYVYTYLYICIYMYSFVHIHTRIHIHMYIYIYVCVCVWFNVSACISVPMFTYACVRVLAFACTHMYVSETCSYMHSRVGSFMCDRTHPCVTGHA